MQSGIDVVHHSTFLIAVCSLMQNALCPNCQSFGSSAVEMVYHLPAKMKFAKGDCFHLKTYVPTPGVERRLKLDVRSLACLTAEQLLARHPRVSELARQLVRGVEVDESQGTIPLRVAELASGLPKLVSQSEHKKEALALYSICTDSERNIWHIPMMDFRIESGEDIGQLRLLKECVGKLKQTDGILLNSGNSYHYYGFQRLSHHEWVRFMTACLLLEPLVDVRYIAHRMLAGKAALRLTKAPEKNYEPKIVACLH